MQNRHRNEGMRAALTAVWQRNRWLVATFVLVLALAVFFAVRSVIFLIYWQNHTDEPIQGWMTLRYVANSYRVEPRVLRDALGMESGKPDRRPLIEIARDRGEPLDAVTGSILQAIERDRQGRPGDAPGS